jgi:hypothetical protein
MSEVFFVNDQIEISDSKAQFGLTYYPIASIGAVAVETKTTNFAQTALVFLAVGLGGWIIQGSLWWLVLLPIGGFGFFMKPEVEFAISLATSSGNQQAFRTKDAELFDNVRMALEKAISNKN